MMRGYFLAVGICFLAGCGDRTVEPAPWELSDPYTPVMSVRINKVIYSDLPPKKMFHELGRLGVTLGKSFVDFKAETDIDDWFEERGADGSVRWISLSCGLSPIVDGDGKITGFVRGRRMVDGKLRPEMRLTD